MISLKSIGFFFLVTLALKVFALPAAEERAYPWTTVWNATVFGPGVGYTAPGVLYARTEIIQNTLYATADNYSPEPPTVYYPFYSSTNGGQTWTHISNITDQANGWGLRYQPSILVLHREIGGYPAGTILFAANSVPKDLSATHIDLYASTDHGYTWKFLSNVAIGGEAVANNGIPAIWEPFLFVYKNKLVIYYSDQRDPNYGQKLVHTWSTDLLYWTDVVDDVHYPTYTDRPGMTTVTTLPNGQYMMTYEYGGGPTNVNGYVYPVYYRISSDPLNFLASTGYRLATPDGSGPNGGSPFITWSSYGGANGTIIVNSASTGNLYLNKALGGVNSWSLFRTSVPGAYSRSLRVLPDPSLVLIAGAGYNGQTINPQVRADVLALPTS